MAILRDPLQEERTAYELLGVEIDAQDRAIKTAFRMAFARREEQPRKLQQANKDLLNPLERILIDVALYDPDSVRQFSPGLVDSRACLELDQRPTTAESWRRQLEGQFPKLELIHSLGVLWYWWAIHAGNHTAALAESLHAHGKPAEDKTSRPTLLRRNSRLDKTSPCNPSKGPTCPLVDCPTRQACMHLDVGVQDAWQRAIAYWSTMLATESFWIEPAKRVGADPMQARDTMEKTIQDHLFRLTDRFQNAGAPGYADELRRTSADFAVELKTAQAMAKADGTLLGASGMRIGCGRILLQELNQLTSVRQRIELSLRTRPGNRTLQRLQTSLSPFGSVDEAMRRKRWDDALNQFDALDPAERDSVEGRKMKARVLTGIGCQQATLNKPDAALKSWKEALSLIRDRQLRKELSEEIDKTCLERAAAVEKRDPDEAVLLLEAGLELTDSQPLRMRLRDLLTNRAIKTYNDVQRRVSRPGGTAGPKEIASLEAALKDLELAADLGSEQAKQQLPAARDALAGIGELKWVTDVNQAIDTINTVQQSIGNRGGDVVAADVTKLQGAVRKLETAARGGSKKAAEQLPVARRVLKDIKITRDRGKWAESANKANAAAGRGDWDTAIRYLREAIRNATGDSRSMLNKNLATSLTNRAIGRVNEAIGGAQGGSGGFNADVMMSLMESQKDLEEAAKLDPGNSHIREQKSQVDTLLSQLTGAAISSPSSVRVPSRSRSRTASKTRSRTTRKSTSREAGFSSSAFWSALLIAVLTAGGRWLIQTNQGNMWMLVAGLAINLLGTLWMIAMARSYEGFGWCGLGVVAMLYLNFTSTMSLQAL